MKTLLTIITTGLMGLACSQAPDLSTLEGIASETWEITNDLAYICNTDLNMLPDVTCVMSIKDWTMDLTYSKTDPINAPFLVPLSADLEWVPDLFCRIGGLVDSEPKITVN